MEQAKDLFERYLNNECSPEEVRRLLHSFAAEPGESSLADGELLKKYLRAYLDADAPIPVDLPAQSDILLEEEYMRIRERIEPSIHAERRPVIRRIGLARWQSVAAVLLFLVLGVGLYFAVNKKTGGISPSVAGDIRPGSYKATLTLADGSVIILDSTSRGLITQQGARRVINLGGHCLTYDDRHGGGVAQDGGVAHAGGQARDEGITKDGGVAHVGGVARAGGASVKVATLYNTISTPKGGEYEVILPDGSKVWLNALSSLRFPMAFDGPTRDITLEGEAYFEIAPRAGKPFRVHVQEMTVDVLGTHFNIMAYPDEQNIQTSLLEGAIKILSPTNSRLLKPGQQSLLNSQNGDLLVKEGDMDEAVAWKNGLFLFNEDDIESVMRRISRWYDVDVRYEGKMPEWNFSGAVSRSMPLSQVIKILQLSAVHIKMDGRQLTLMP